MAANTVSEESTSGSTYLGKQLLMTLFAVSSLVTFIYYPNAYVAIGCVLGLTGLGRLLDMAATSTARIPLSGRAVLVTGADTDIGLALASQLVEMDITVFAACRNASGPGADGLRDLKDPGVHVLQLDVSDSRETKEALKYVKEIVGVKGLWAVVNMASANLMGDVELTTMEQYERLINTNQLGVVRVTKTFLPLVRESKGRVVNVTSVTGLLSDVYQSAFAMTKFASEAFMDSLRMEMRRFGVKVIGVEPSSYGPDVTSEDSRIDADGQAMWHAMSSGLRHTYGKEYVLHHAKTAKKSRHTPSFVERVAHRIVDATFLCEPRMRYVVGRTDKYLNKDKMRVLMARFLPSWYMDGLMLYDVRHYPNPRALVGQPHSHSH